MWYSNHVNRFFIFCAVLCAVAIPQLADAFFPFGGRVVSPPIKCDLGVLFFVKGLPYSGPVMWTPGLKPNAVNMGAPPMFSQCVLGSLIPGFIPCTIKGAPVGGGPAISPIIGFGSSPPGCVF